MAHSNLISELHKVYVLTFPERRFVVRPFWLGVILTGRLVVHARQTPQPDFLKIRLAEQIFRLIFGLAEFLRKLQISAENTAQQYKFGLHIGHSK